MNRPINDFGDNQYPAQRDGSHQVVSSRFQCPACRARQSFQSECRRCGADLSLIVAARRRIAFIQEQLKQADEGSPAHNRYKKEFQILAGSAFTSNDD